MNTKHTPGPWQVFEDGCGGTFIISAGDPQEADCIAKVYAGGGAVAYKGRAPLLAAAPELLEALQHILERFPSMFSAEGSMSVSGNKARAAIAKATGQ